MCKIFGHRWLKSAAGKYCKRCQLIEVNQYGKMLLSHPNQQRAVLRVLKNGK